MRTCHGLLLACALLHLSEARACGPDYTMSEDFRFWLLQPELTDIRGLRAFNFSTNKLYADNVDAVRTLPYRTNIAEWKAIVGPQVPDTAIEAILYGMSPAYYLGHEAALKRRNLFLRRLEPMGSDWIGFIRYAKTCEQLVDNTDPWGFAEHDATGIRKAWSEGLDRLRRAKDERLRARIAFQLVRLAHYHQPDDGPDLDAAPYYARHLAPLRGKSWLEGAAAFYLAGKQTNPERDLAFAALFDRAPDKQDRMVQLFENKQIDAYLNFAASDAHRAQLLVMRGLQHPGRALNDLEYIATWDPSNPHLAQLLGREVNKLEDWLLTPELTEKGTAIGFWTYDDSVDVAAVYRTDLAYLHQVRQFIAGRLADPRTVHKAVLRTLDGHLCLVAGDAEGCRLALAPVVKDAGAPPLVRLQARIDVLLATVMEQRRLNDAGRAAILEVVEAARSASTDSVNVPVLLDQLHLYLGKKLLARGDKAEGLFLLTRTGRSYGNMNIPGNRHARYEAFMRAAPADYDRMIALLDKRHKTPFEEYLMNEDLSVEGQDPYNRSHSGRFSREVLLDYKAMWFLRAGDLDQAVAAFRAIPDSHWAQWPHSLFEGDDPFLVNLADPHNGEKKDQGRYNKRTIVERMIALRDEAARDPRKRGLNNYLLGNAWYNMSWHGKYWILQRIDWSMWEMSGYGDHLPIPGDDQYYGTATAQRYYLEALATATDPPLKAMACRMAEVCERHARSWKGTSEEERPPSFSSRLTDRKSRAIYADIRECRGVEALIRRFR